MTGQTTASPMLTLLKSKQLLEYKILSSTSRPSRKESFGLLEVFPDQPVLSAAGADQAVIQPLAALADPTDLPGRNAGHQGKILNVFRHDGTGGDQRAAPYRMTAHNRAIRAQRCALAHARTRINSVHREVRPRSIYIRENTGRPTEDIVLYFDALIDGNIVLDADTIPNAGVVAHIHILTQGTVRSDDSPSLDMTKMPNFRSCADAYAIVDIRAFMNEEVGHPSSIYLT